MKHAVGAWIAQKWAEEKADLWELADRLDTERDDLIAAIEHFGKSFAGDNPPGNENRPWLCDALANYRARGMIPGISCLEIGRYR